jgi:hypothetical protein
VLALVLRRLLQSIAIVAVVRFLAFRFTGHALTLMGGQVARSRLPVERPALVAA